MADAHKNFALSTVATAPSPADSGTSLVVATGEGTKFPAVPFNAVIFPTGANPTTANAEIVRVTNISTDTFTITRAQESTVARTVVVGDQIMNAATAKTFTDIEALALGGDVVGPSSAADNAVARFDGTTGKLLQNTAALTIDDSGNLVSTGTSLTLDSAGTATSAVDRQATTNFASFLWRTNGTDEWTIGLRNDSTNDFHFRDNINSRSPLKIVQSSAQIEFANATAAASALLLGGDANIYRSAADTLKTDDNLIVGAPGTSAGSVATIDGTQTLSGKTFTTPKFADLGYIADANGNEMLVFDTVGSAIPYVRMYNAATGGVVGFEADGETNQHIQIIGKGNGLTKTSVLRQDDTTNSYKHNSVILTGWGVNSVGANPSVSETVTFGITFAQRPIVVLTYGGDHASAATYGSGDTNVKQAFAVAVLITTTSFKAWIMSRDATNWTAGNQVFYQWIAIGEL